MVHVGARSRGHLSRVDGAVLLIWWVVSVVKLGSTAFPGYIGTVRL
jgi:hypothetical protein